MPFVCVLFDFGIWESKACSILRTIRTTRSTNNNEHRRSGAGLIWKKRHHTNLNVFNAKENAVPCLFPIPNL